MTEEELAHFGVRGMKWGVRRESSGPMTQQEKTQRLNKLDRKMDRLDMNKALTGVGAIGYESKRMADKRRKKDPNFTFKDFSPEQKKAWREKSSAKAKRRAVRQGAAAAGIILGGGLLLVSRVAGSPQAIRGAQVSVGLLSTIPLRQKLSDISSISTANKRQAILDEREELKYGKKVVR